MRVLEMQEFWNKEVVGTFPEWVPTEKDKSQWHGLLKNIELKHAQRAMDLYYKNRTASEKSPTFSRMLKYIYETKEITYSKKHLEWFFCLCVSHWNLRKLGTGLLYYYDGSIDNLFGNAENQCEELSYLYRGTWVPVYGETIQDRKRYIRDIRLAVLKYFETRKYNINFEYNVTCIWSEVHGEPLIIDRALPERLSCLKGSSYMGQLDHDNTGQPREFYDTQDMVTDIGNL